MSRIVFRILEDDGSRWYFNQDGNWTGDASEAYVFATMDEARREMRELRSIELDEAKGARICTILTPAESRRKAAATALRELAAEIRGDLLTFGRCDVATWNDAKLQDAAKAESRADALWPRKGAGR